MCQSAFNNVFPTGKLHLSLEELIEVIGAQIHGLGYIGNGSNLHEMLFNIIHRFSDLDVAFFVGRGQIKGLTNAANPVGAGLLALQGSSKGLIEADDDRV